jgi:hypothetical protein
MLPDVHSAPAVAREVVRDRERQLAQHEVLRVLPAIPSRGLVWRRRLACCTGERLVRMGEWLRRYGEAEVREPLHGAAR